MVHKIPLISKGQINFLQVSTSGEVWALEEVNMILTLSHAHQYLSILPPCGETASLLLLDLLWSEDAQVTIYEKQQTLHRRRSNN